MAFDERGPRVTAVLGPTNTGKTHFAIERMLAHRTGVIGLPLRLLAREVYDRIVALRGPSVVALVTGEERIVPRARRLLGVHRRGDARRHRRRLPRRRRDPALRRPRPRPHLHRPPAPRPRPARDAVPRRRDHARRGSPASSRARSSPGASASRSLSYTGARKISRMPPRSAIVGFSVDDVYAIAELIRRQRGGAAVVMGALSPAHAQRPGRALPERRRRPSRRHRRDRHGPQPRHQPRRLRRHGEVRRPPPPPSHPRRARPDRRPRRPLHHRRHLRRHRRGLAARPRGGRGDREPPLPAARPPAMAEHGARLRQPGHADRQPRARPGPPGPAAGARGRRPRDAEGTRRDPRRGEAGCATPPTPSSSGMSARSPTSAR